MIVAALRWFLVVPVSILVFLGVSVLLILLGTLLPVSDTVSQVIDQVLQATVAPAAAIIAGAYVAPRSRVGTSVVLFLIQVAYSVWVIAKLIAHPASTNLPLVGAILAVVLLDVSAAVAAYLVVCHVRAAGDEDPQPHHWAAPLWYLLLVVAGIMYVYGYFGQGISLIATIIRQVGAGNIFALFPPIALIFMLFSWQFWSLVVVAALGYGGTRLAESQLARLSESVNARVQPTEPEDSNEVSSLPRFRLLAQGGHHVDQLVDSLSQAERDKLNASPFAKNLYLNAYSYALVAHAYQMVKTVLDDSNVPPWQEMGETSNEQTVRTLGAYFGFLLAQSMLNDLRSEEPAALAMKRDTLSVTELHFGDQVAARTAAESDAKRMASDMQDAMLSFHNGGIIARTIDALLGTRLDSSQDPFGYDKASVIGQSFTFHKENMPKSLRYAADRMK